MRVGEGRAIRAGEALRRVWRVGVVIDEADRAELRRMKTEDACCAEAPLDATEADVVEKEECA